MTLTRPYTDETEVAPGDVVTMQDNEVKNHPFSTSLVMFLEPTEYGILVHLARPHARGGQIIGSRPYAPYLTAEQHSVIMDAFLTRYLVHTTGASGAKDNRGEVQS